MNAPLRFLAGYLICILVAVALCQSITVDAGSGWGNIPSSGPTHMYHSWLSHQQACGTHPLDREHKQGREWVQHFPRCTMYEASVRVVPIQSVTPTPSPSPTPTSAPRPTNTPTTAPTATPWLTPVVYPTAMPTATSGSSDPAHYLLGLLNSDRGQYGIPPLSLNLTQSIGTGNCVGSQGHSQAMRDSGGIWHVNDQYPAASFPSDLCVPYMTAGENVGMDASGSEANDLSQLDQLMMAEQPPADGHRENILNPAFRQVGIGIVESGGQTWMTEDFTG